MEEQEKQSTAQWLFPKLFTVIIAIFVIGFGIQTYFLVDALMPSDQMLMKCLTVFAFDGCALIYSIAKQYYPMKSEKSLHAVRVMFRVCLTGSAICTALWVLLSADHFDWSLVPPFLVFIAYVLVTCATTVNVLVFYYIWEQESSSPKRAKSTPTKPSQPAVQPEPKSAPTPPPPPAPTPAPQPDMAALLTAMQNMATQAAQVAAAQATQSLMERLTVKTQPEPAKAPDQQAADTTTSQLPKEPAPTPSGAKLNGK